MPRLLRRRFCQKTRSVSSYIQRMDLIKRNLATTVADNSVEKPEHTITGLETTSALKAHPEHTG